MACVTVDGLFYINYYVVHENAQVKQRSASVKNRNVVFARCGEGFGANKKLVACFLKLVARISKSEPLIFAPSQTRMNKGLGGIC